MPLDRFEIDELGMAIRCIPARRWRAIGQVRSGRLGNGRGDTG
jgi:hypothetical protein